MRFDGLLAVCDASFDLPKGAITALIGPNGAGKTTMINVISGIYRPTGGTVLFCDQDITGVPPHQIAHRGLTRTFQNLQVFATMTVIENAMVGMHSKTRIDFLGSMFRVSGFAKEEEYIEQRAWEVLRFLDLEGKAHVPASSLSFGEQKRLEIARALAPRPRVLLLDEPVAGLNMTESLEVANLIQAIKNQGIAVLLVEHDMNLVMGISDKVVVLNYGRLIAQGLPCDIQRNDEVLSAYLGSVDQC